MSTISELAKQGRWRITDVQDLGSMSGRCSICSRPIRYEYHLENLVIEHKDFVVGSKCGPTLVNVSEWKAMNADYVQTQKVKQSQNFRTMLDRFVALRPEHEFMASIHERVRNGWQLSPRQLEVVQEVFSETDWETLEVGVLMRARINAVLPLVTNPRSVELLQSFEAWTYRRQLTVKQLNVLEKVEAQVQKQQ